MPRFDKWLAEVDPDDTVQRVGRKAIRVRLAAVVHFLEQAEDKSNRADAIHQLRIWTRRAAAALRLFKPIVPRAAGKKMKKRLRKIRAAAGQERDCDVLLESLRSHSVSGLRSGADEPPKSIVQALKKRRRAARRAFSALRRRRLKQGKLQRQCGKLIDDLAWPKRHSRREAPPFTSWCREQLVPLGEEFFARADGTFARDAQLHELRIAGKRLRYALELSPAALPMRLHQRLYEALSDLQERLGTVCDHLSAVARLKDWRSGARSRQERESLRSQIRREQDQLARRRQQFLRWWSPARRKRMQVDWNAVTLLTDADSGGV
jgi:CHAD domain-containing protein